MSKNRNELERLEVQQVLRNQGSDEKDDLNDRANRSVEIEIEASSPTKGLKQ